tara:strand:- start:422 stop:8506 length:8085 start_codon:yes stop_codon:yes gene_type:complete
MEELIGIRLPNGEFKLVKKDSDEARLNEQLPGVTDKASLYKYRLETEGKLSQQEEMDLQTQANTKITRDVKRTRKVWDRGNTPRVVTEVVGQEEVFPWQDLVGKGTDEDTAKQQWIDTTRAKMIQEKTDLILHDMENDIQPWYKDVANFVMKGRPGAVPRLSEYERTRLAISASFKADYLQKEKEVTTAIQGLKNRKSHIENIGQQIAQIENTPQEQITQEIVSYHRSLINEYKAHVKLFQDEAELLNNINTEAKSLAELADLSRRSHNELDVATMKITKTALNFVSGVSQLGAELTPYAMLKNFGGIDLNDDDDIEMVPEALRGYVRMRSGAAAYEVLDGLSDMTAKAAEEIGDQARKNIQLGDIDSLGDFGVFMLDLFSEQAINTAITMSTGGVGLALVAGGAAGNKMSELNIEMENGKKISGLQYYGGAMGFGLAEYITERVSLGQAKGMFKALGSGFTKNNFKKAFLSEATEQGIDMAKELGGKYTLRTMNLGKAFQRYAVNVNQEGSAEMFATLGQNFIDKHVLGNDVDILDGVGTAYLTGAMMSGFGFQAPVIASDLYQAYTIKDTWGKVNSNTLEIINLDQKIATLQKQLQFADQNTDRAGIKEAIKQARKQQDQLLRFNLDAKLETEKRVDNLSQSEKRQAMDLMIHIRKKKGAIDKINAQNLDPTTKTKMINGIIKEINMLEYQHEVILNKAQLDADSKTASKLAMKDAVLTGKNINVVKGRGVDQLLDNGIEAIDNSNLTNQEKNNAKDKLRSEIKKAKDGKFDVHGFSMSFGNQNFTFQDLVNSAKGSGFGNASVFSHELSHQTLFRAIVEQGGDLTQMANLVTDYINLRYKGLSEAVKDDPAYKEFNEAQRAEEKLARAIDFMRKYDLKADQTLLGSMLGSYQNIAGPVDNFNEIKTGEDVFNMLHSFADSFDTGEIQGAAAAVIRGEVKMAKATAAVQEMQRKDGVDFSMGKEQLFDQTERLLGISQDADGNYSWSGFDVNKAMEAGFGWKNEIARRFKKYSKFSDYGKHIEDMIADVAYGDVKGARGIVDIIRRWNPAEGKSISAWINGQIEQKIDGVRKKYGVGLDFKVSLGDFTPGEVDNIVNNNNFDHNSKGANLNLSSRVKIRLKDELKSEVAKNIDAAVKELNIDPKGKNFKDLKDATPSQTQEMFGIKPKPGNLTRGDITNAQEFIEENADVLMSMLPNGATAAGTSTGVQKVLLDKFYTKGESAKMKDTGSAAGLQMQVKNPIPEQFTIKQVTNENGEIVQQKVETDAYKAYKKDFLEYFGIIEDGANLYKKETNVSARIKALVMQTGKMLTNQAVRDQQLAKGQSVDALKFIADGKSEVMFSRTIRQVGKNKPDVAIGIVDKLATLELSPNDMDNMETILPGHLAEFDITKGQLNNIVKDLKGIWSKYSNFKPSPTASNLTATELFKQDIKREAGLDPDSPLTFKGINGYNGPTGTAIFNSKKDIESSRANLAFMLKNKIISREQFIKNMSGLATASKIGDGRFIPTQPGSTTIIENKNYKPDKKNTNRYGLFANKADFDAFVDKYAPGDQVDTKGGNIVYDLHRKNRMFKKEELTRAVELSKEHNKFLGELADKLKKAYEAGQINDVQVAALIQTMNNNPASLLRIAGIMDFVQDDLVAGKIDLEHMTPAKDIGLSMFEYITGGNKQTDFKNKLNGYRTALISKQAHNTINKFYKDFMPSWYDGTMMSLVRYYNPFTIGKFNVKLKQLSTGKVIGPEIIENKKAFEAAQKNNLKALQSTQVMYSKNLSQQEIIDKLQLVDKALELAKKKSKVRKGISVIDFDDTLATSNSKIIVTMPDGKVTKITPAKFATDAGILEEQGAKFDFKEFNDVVDGKPGPFLQRALELQKKFGSKDMFILTARPQAAAVPIQKFLKSVGLNIPLENITGLEDGSPLAKADFMVQKAAEGYNDFLFADDALGNVKAVKTVLDVVDVKSDVQQVMFSRTLSKDFNDMIERDKGVLSEAKYSDAVARIKGDKTGQFTFYLPPSAEDFMGLMYNFLGKGKQGDADLQWMQDNIMNPYQRGVDAMNIAKQKITEDYRELKKLYPDVKKKLNNPIPGSVLTHEQAIRIHLWNKAGHKIPGLAARDLDAVNKAMKNDPNLQLFAESLIPIVKTSNYVVPGNDWVAETILTDLQAITGKIGRKQYLAQFEQNVDEVFNKDNLNKIQALYGKPIREAIENAIFRMKTGRNRNFGGSRLMNEFQDWINASVGATMFFNFRSATLQSLSTVNFLNWSDNNPLAAARAFANQKQYWKDFSMIFNSPKLKQRRGGLEINVQEAEMAAAAKKGGIKGVINKLLSIGFTPTRMVDSLAISLGGATMYRNRLNRYVKEGYTQEEAAKRAFEDFSKISEETQQSSDPALISSIQASPMGRFLFAWQNTPFQYNRLMKKAARDLINRRGDPKTHISKIIYYGAVQNFIFTAMQNALFALLPGMHGDEEEDEEREANRIMGKKVRVINNMTDTILRGSGLPGAVVSTVKNILMTYKKQEDKSWGTDHAYTIIEAINLSPPLGSKIRKMYSSHKTMTYERDVIAERGFNLDSPIYSVIGSMVEGTTNIPMQRAVNILTNAYAALDARHQTWQRVAMAMGWNSWDVGVEPFPEHDIIKDQAKERRKQQGIEKRKKTVAEFNAMKKQIEANMPPATKKWYKSLTVKERNEIIRKEIERLKNRENE